MLASKQGFGSPAAFQTSATEVLSCSSSFGSTSVNASQIILASLSDSQLSHVEVSKDSKDGPSKPMSLAEKKLQRLARNRATASVSRSRKREHLHTLQMRLCALEQENKDLVHQLVVRDAELERFRRERGQPDESTVIVQPQPAPELVEAKSPKAIILRPATSALPRILCTTALPTLTQEHSQAGTSSHDGAGTKHKATSEPSNKLSRQRSCSLTPSTDDSIPVTQAVKVEPSHDCLEGPAHQQASMPAALCQHPKHQATFNVVTSGEYSHLTLKRQLSVNTALLSPFIQQPDAPAGPHQAHPLTVFPGGEDGYSGSDLHRGGSQSYDSCYLPVGEMPSFAFEAGDTDMPQQQGLWESGPDAQIAHAQASIHVQSAANDALGAHSKPQDWCSIMPHSLALSSEAPPCVPDLLPLPPSDPPPPCSSWDHQAWQASWQHHQHQPQHQPQQHLTCSVAQPSVQVATCPEGTTAAVGLEFEPAASGCDPNAAWWLLPSCSVENLLQADSLFATGNHDDNQSAAGQIPV